MTYGAARTSERRVRRGAAGRSASGAATASALLLPNCPQFFIAELGAWKIGAIVAPLNPIYTEHELEGPLREQRDRDDRHADALLRARQARAAADAAAARHRHEHQGVLPAAAAAAVHAGPREAGRRSRHARARRPRLRGLLLEHITVRRLDAGADHSPTIRPCC